jgi:hypothetical protein
MAFGALCFGSGSTTTHELFELFCTLTATVLIDRHFAYFLSILSISCLITALPGEPTW